MRRWITEVVLECAKARPPFRALRSHAGQFIAPNSISMVSSRELTNEACLHLSLLRRHFCCASSINRQNRRHQIQQLRRIVDIEELRRTIGNAYSVNVIACMLALPLALPRQKTRFHGQPLPQSQLFLNLITPGQLKDDIQHCVMVCIHQNRGITASLSFNPDHHEEMAQLRYSAVPRVR